MNSITTPPASVDSRRVDQLLAHYGESHQNPKNELIHFVAIPLIMLSLIGLLFALHPYAAYFFMAASMVYYARLSIIFLAAMGAWSAVTLALVHAMGEAAFPLSVAIFIAAWILQFIGHKLEGKKPSFFEDLQYLWVGPLFVLAKLLIRPDDVLISVRVELVETLRQAQGERFIFHRAGSIFIKLGWRW